MKRLWMVLAMLCLTVAAGASALPAGAGENVGMSRSAGAGTDDRPVSFVRLLNMDSWAKLQTADAEDKMEGAGSVSCTTVNQSGGVVLNIFRFGETALGQDSLNVDAGALDAREDNLALAFWAKIDNPAAMQGGDIQLTSLYGAGGVNSDVNKVVTWPCGTANVTQVGYLQNKVRAGAWTWVTLPFAESDNRPAGGRGGAELTAFLRNIHYFRLHCNTYPGQALTVKLDDVRLVNLDSFGTEPPTYDGTDTRRGTGTGEYMPDSAQTAPDAPDFYRLLNCDGDFQNFEMDEIDYKEGLGCVRADGAGLVSIYAGMCNAPFGSRQDSDTIQEPMPGRDIRICEKDLGIAFWMKLTTFGDAGACSGVLSFGSGGGSDYDLYTFQVGSFAARLRSAAENGDGWAWIVLPLSLATVSGRPDLSNINFFYTHILSPEPEYTMTLRIDDVRLIDCRQAANLRAPSYAEEFYPVAAGSGDYVSRLHDNSFNRREVSAPGPTAVVSGPLLLPNWAVVAVGLALALAACGCAVILTIQCLKHRGESK